MGGMIAAIGSVLITPWNLYNSPETIHYTLDTLGAFIGPLYGVLIADYYLVKRRQVDIDALYTLESNGKYHYKKGYNPVAVVVTAISAVAGMLVVFLGSSEAATYTWFIGAGLAFVLYMVGSRMFAVQANYPEVSQSTVQA
jgi:NCS1 family nucleobase:cation symporter-1